MPLISSAVAAAVAALQDVRLLTSFARRSAKHDCFPGRRSPIAVFCRGVAVDAPQNLVGNLQLVAAVTNAGLTSMGDPQVDNNVTPRNRVVLSYNASGTHFFRSTRNSSMNVF